MQYWLFHLEVSPKTNNSLMSVLKGLLTTQSIDFLGATPPWLRDDDDDDDDDNSQVCKELRST